MVQIKDALHEFSKLFRWLMIITVLLLGVMFMYKNKEDRKWLTGPDEIDLGTILTNNHKRKHARSL